MSCEIVVYLDCFVHEFNSDMSYDFGFSKDSFKDDFMYMINVLNNKKIDVKKVIIYD